MELVLYKTQVLSLLNYRRAIQCSLTALFMFLKLLYSTKAKPVRLLLDVK